MKHGLRHSSLGDRRRRGETQKASSPAPVNIHVIVALLCKTQISLSLTPVIIQLWPPAPVNKKSSSSAPREQTCHRRPTGETKSHRRQLGETESRRRQLGETQRHRHQLHYT